MDGVSSMVSQPRLPTRFPVGTRYIVEGTPSKGGKLQIVSRYVIMPNGLRYDLMTSEQVRNPARARKVSSGPKRAETSRRAYAG